MQEKSLQGQTRVRSSTGCSHANRGKTFESEIDAWIERIQKNGYHGHKNHPKRTFKGKFVSGEPFDYEIFTQDRKMCFDAKECKSDRWSLSNAKLNQVNALKQCKNSGLDAFFLVKFGDDMVAFDVDTVISAMQERRMNLKREDGQSFEFNC